jgi:hypothetical protein
MDNDAATSFCKSLGFKEPSNLDGIKTMAITLNDHHLYGCGRLFGVRALLFLMTRKHQ